VLDPSLPNTLQDVVVIADEFHASIVEIALKYIYTGKLDLVTKVKDIASRTSAFLKHARLYLLADKLQLSDLKEKIIADEPDLSYDNKDSAIEMDEYEATNLIFQQTKDTDRGFRNYILRGWLIYGYVTSSCKLRDSTGQELDLSFIELLRKMPEFEVELAAPHFRHSQWDAVCKQCSTRFPLWRNGSVPKKCDTCTKESSGGDRGG